MSNSNVFDGWFDDHIGLWCSCCGIWDVSFIFRKSGLIRGFHAIGHRFDLVCCLRNHQTNCFTHRWIDAPHYASKVLMRVHAAQDTVVRIAGIRKISVLLMEKLMLKFWWLLANALVLIRYIFRCEWNYPRSFLSNASLNICQSVQSFLEVLPTCVNYD